MNPSLALCLHLGANGPAELAIRPDDVIDFEDGPVTAGVRCGDCDRMAMACLLDWSATRRVRVYALAAVASEDFALFARNTQRGSCDLGRLADERHALLAACGPAEWLVALDLDAAAGAAAVRGVARLPGVTGLPTGAWDERLPAVADATWFARLGLDKATGCRSAVLPG